MVLAGALASIAALLAAVGIYGLLAYSVGQRAREIGVRKALGASARQIVALVTRQAVTVVGAGLAAGLAAAAAAHRLLAAHLWGVAPHDPLTLGAGALLLAAAAAVACRGPVRRALRVDPCDVLRAE